MAKAAPARTALRFTRLRLRNWRNFVELDVELGRRGFLVGANASGKSNLLDVFRFLRDVASPGGGFDEAVRDRGGVSLIRSLAASRDPSVEVRVNVGRDNDDDGVNDEWEYLLRFRQENRGRRSTYIEEEKVWHREKLVFARPDEDDEKDPARLTQTYLEQVTANVEFRELAEFFASVSYLHVVPQSIRSAGVLPSREDDQYGSDLIERIARTSTRTRAAWLRRIRDALQVAVPQLIDLELVKDERGVPHLRAKYNNWRARGAWQGEREFSDGTLRLLGLLWSMLEQGGPLLLEEPEISLHPGVVEHLSQMLARMQLRTGRQAIISTHSPDLLRDSGIGLHEVLVLEPEEDGTRVQRVIDMPDLRALVEGGIPLGDVVMPETRPANASQLAFYAR